MKILIIRNNANEVDLETYNLQELGLAKALVLSGHTCDIVYYTRERNQGIQVVDIGDGKSVTIFWCRAIKVLNNAIYFSLFKGCFFDNYDVIQTIEYNQIMTYLLSKYASRPTVLYHGPYRDLKYRGLNRIYDFFFLKGIIKNINGVITKSNYAEGYLREKGFKKVKTLGVGLDITKFKSLSNDLGNIISIDELKGYKILLYVGRLEERRNIKFLFKVLRNVLKINNKIKLILVGDGEQDLVTEYFTYAKEIGVYDNIIHIKEIRQQYLSAIYRISDIFIFASSYEIFGMVLLESMYFSLPIISSVTGGSKMLIENEKDGILIGGFDSLQWSERIISLLEDEKYRINLGINSRTKILEKFTWDVISKQFCGVYKNAIEDFEKKRKNKK
ncbi:MAG: glycosyltransferase family 4 protein [Bacillota bacterium]|nr:glycosyltransferase family 4 protein [Bacillota bacterium]